MEDKYRPISMALNCPAIKIKFNSSPLAQRRSYVCVMAKPIPSLWLYGRRSLTTIIAMLSNSQGELADKLTRLRKEFKQTMYLYKAACKEYQAMSATEKGELKDKLTKLIKELQQTMSAEDLYNSACKELQAMAADCLYNFDYQELQAMPAEYLYNFACNSVTEKTKYKAGTSKGKERIEGEREDDVTVQHEDMFEEEKRSILEPAGALALAGTEAYRKYYRLKGENVVATTSGATMNFDRLRLVTELAGVGRKREAVLATYMPEEPKGAGTSKGERLKGEGEDDVTVQHERKYEAGTSKGRELIEGEGEDDVTEQYIVDAIGSFFKERLKDDDLLFSLSSQPPNFGRERAEEREDNFGREREEERDDNFGRERAEEREDNFGRERAEEREHNFSWVEGLGSGVSRAIKFGILVAIVAPCIAIYLLNKNTGKKFDDIALQIKAANEARIGTTGCASPVSFNIKIAMFNLNISASPRLGFLNREARGNDVEVTGSK